MVRWITGITLKRYFGFTEHQMRKMRKEVGKKIMTSEYGDGKWLYDLDKVLEKHKPTEPIPWRLITEEQ